MGMDKIHEGKEFGPSIIIEIYILVPIFVAKFEFGPSIIFYLNLVPILGNLI